MQPIHRFKERSENHRFTYQYAQPDDYHFCQDSVIFAAFIAEQVQANPLTSDSRVLDVCSGCGVLGLELAYYLPELEQVDFMEVQEIYRDFFLQNLQITAQQDGRFRFLARNYEALLTSEFGDYYDLIVCNPPYFLKGEGLLSKSELRNRSRFFLDSSPKFLFQGLAAALKPGGQAYVLTKLGDIHGRNAWRELQLWLSGRAEIELVADIRGTAVLKLQK